MGLSDLIHTVIKFNSPFQTSRFPDTKFPFAQYMYIKYNKWYICNIIVSGNMYKKWSHFLLIQITGKSQMDVLTKKKEFDHPAISKVEIDDLKLSKIYLTDRVEPEVLKHALEFFYSGKFPVSFFSLAGVTRLNTSTRNRIKSDQCFTANLIIVDGDGDGGIVIRQYK